ncbi:MAG: PBS lyase, partial [Nitrospirota bacterium]
MRRRGEARCPFCGCMIDIPHEIRTALGNNILGGKCECGAVYVFDRSGHNLGQAFVDALNFACEGKYGNPWDMIPEEDYQEVLLYYDWRTHTLS